MNNFTILFYSLQKEPLGFICKQNSIWFGLWILDRVIAGTAEQVHLSVEYDVNIANFTFDILQ